MSTTARVYPRQAWVLMPSYKPKEVTVIKPYGTYSPGVKEWDIIESGKSYHHAYLYASKEVAIATGKDLCLRMQLALNKRQISLDKKIAALNKAEKE